MKQKAFTIVELLIVIVVIAILAAVTIVAYNGIRDSALKSAAQLAVKQATQKIKLYQVDNSDSYPQAAGIDGMDNLIALGLNDHGDTRYQYSSTASTNFCLTATVGDVSYKIDNNSTVPSSGACSGHALTENLLVNGDGSYGNMTNMNPYFTYNSTDYPPGSFGSFVASNGTYGFHSSSALIPVDPAKSYKLSGWGKQMTSGVTNSRWYLALHPHDVDGLGITPDHYMYRPGTTTTLAQPLNNGDTVVYLNNISLNWYDVNDANGHFRTFIFWNYVDGQGTVWPPETYSRNTWLSNIYNGGVGAINRTNNTITLNRAWTGGSYPAGHPVSNGGAAGTFMYTAAVNDLMSDTTWQKWTSPIITGITPTGLNGSTHTFPLPTRFVKVTVGVNSGSPPTTSRPAFGGVIFNEVQP